MQLDAAGLHISLYIILCALLENLM